MGMNDDEPSSQSVGIAVLWRSLDRLASLLATWESKGPRRWMLLTVVIATGFSLGSKFPAYTDPYEKFPGNFAAFPGTPYGHAVTWWLEHPFQPVPVDVFFPPQTRHDPLIAGSVSHLDKLTFRAFVPLLNQVVGGGFWTLVGANHAAVLATFFLLYGICRRITGDPVQATALVWAYALTWAGTWGFNDMVCGDAVAIGLMLAAVAVRPAWVVGLLVIAAAFTDERVVFAAPLLALFRCWLMAPRSVAGPTVPTTRPVRPVLLGIAAYGVIRLTLAWVFKLSTGTSMLATPEILLYHLFVSFPGKFFGVFEFLWLLPVGFGLSLVLTAGPSRRTAGHFAAAMAVAAIPAFLVWDINRSLCYLLPGVMAAACFFPANEISRRRLMLAVALASLAWVEVYGSVFRRLLL
jgi:hypothetical protein